jgi:hypothetical protein
MKEGAANELNEFSKLDSRVLLKDIIWQDGEIQ